MVESHLNFPYILEACSLWSEPTSLTREETSRKNVSARKKSDLDLGWTVAETRYIQPGNGKADSAYYVYGTIKLTERKWTVDCMLWNFQQSPSNKRIQYIGWWTRQGHRQNDSCRRLGETDWLFRISVSRCSGLSNVMLGESGITIEETSDFSAADASVIVNLKSTKLTTNDFNFFPLLLGFNNFETLWHHCWITADTTCKWCAFVLSAGARRGAWIGSRE